MNHKLYHFHQTLKSLRQTELLEWCQTVMREKQEKQDARCFLKEKRNSKLFLL